VHRHRRLRRRALRPEFGLNESLFLSISGTVSGRR
jgi:hypothetical protein